MSFVKRCIGLPGDTLYILPSGEVFTKMGIYTPDPISFQGYSKVDSLLLVSNQDSLWLSFTKIEEWKIGDDRQKQWQSVGLRAKYISYKSHNVERIIIPQKEYPITLNQQNKSDWKELIRRDRNYYESKEKSEHAIDSIMTAGNYRFTQDFYFFIGDNMNFASDSRKWQSVPEKLIIGKVLFRFRWNPLKLKRFKWLG
jgi:signal peptidase I